MNAVWRMRALCEPWRATLLGAGAPAPAATPSTETGSGAPLPPVPLPPRGRSMPVIVLRLYMGSPGAHTFRVAASMTLTFEARVEPLARGT